MTGLRNNRILRRDLVSVDQSETRTIGRYRPSRSTSWKKGGQEEASRAFGRGIFPKEKTSSQVRVGAPSARQAGGRVPCRFCEAVSRRLRIARARCGTRVAGGRRWSRCSSTSSSFFSGEALMPYRPSLAFISLYMRDLDSRLWRRACSYGARRWFSPKSFRVLNRSSWKYDIW